MEIFYKCGQCGKVIKKYKQVGWYRCKCGFKNNNPTEVTPVLDDNTTEEDNIEQTEVQTQEETPIILDDKPINQELNVEQILSTNKMASEIPQQTEQPKKETKKSSDKNTKYLTKSFTPELVSRIPKTINKRLYDKYGNDFNVTDEETEILSNAWADALNELMPEAPTKEIKIVTAIGLTLVTYVPRVLEIQSKRGKKNAKPRDIDNNNPASGDGTNNSVDN